MLINGQKGKGLRSTGREPFCHEQCRRQELNLHPPLEGLGPEPSASANSATSALCLYYESLDEVSQGEWSERS